MMGFCSAPAHRWRAFFVLGFLVASVGFGAVPKGQSPPPLTPLGGADPAEARAAIEQVRRQGIQGNYFLEFQLRVMPRRGKERLIAGKMWGMRNDMGPLSRVTLILDGAGAEKTERRFLIQNGRDSALWPEPGIRADPARGDPVGADRSRHPCDP